MLADDLSGVVLNLTGPRDNIRLTYSKNGTDLVLSWPAVAGLRLEQTETLAPAVWKAVEGVVGSSFRASTSEGTRYYRVNIP